MFGNYLITILFSVLICLNTAAYASENSAPTSFSFDPLFPNDAPITISIQTTSLKVLVGDSPMGTANVRSNSDGYFFEAAFIGLKVFIPSAVHSGDILISEGTVWDGEGCQFQAVRSDETIQTVDAGDSPQMKTDYRYLIEAFCTGIDGLKIYDYSTNRGIIGFYEIALPSGDGAYDITQGYRLRSNTEGLRVDPKIFERAK